MSYEPMNSVIGILALDIASAPESERGKMMVGVREAIEQHLRNEVPELSAIELDHLADLFSVTVAEVAVRIIAASSDQTGHC